MPVIVDAPSKASLVEVQPLDQRAFAEYGTVIENPDPAREPAAKSQPLPPNAVHANQGTALKYLDVTMMLDLYASAPSKVPSKAVMNMFVCSPRDLLRSSEDAGDVEGSFPIEILERHPFTTQTFIPLGLPPADQETTRYLVIVAPSNSPSSKDEHLPVPSQDDVLGKVRHRLPGRGFPDLTRLQAFIARGNQAVTYGAGTWHAPMVVIGERHVEFVVVQFANGVEIEDCQEVEIKSPPGSLLTCAVIRSKEMGRGLRIESAKL
jgi:ureidoglycolate lyase